MIKRIITNTVEKEAQTLRKRSIKVHKFHEPGFKSAVKDVIETLKSREDGAGLSAIQIGIPLRIFALKKSNGQVVVMINPEIVEYSDVKVTDNEGCLSIPNTYGPVERFFWVRMRGKNVFGRPTSWNVEDFEARVAQHELDHLNGILFLDKVTDKDKIFTNEASKTKEL